MAVSTAVDLSAVARVLGIKTEFKNLNVGQAVLLPQRLGIIGQGNTASTYATTKAQVFSALEVANAYGFGSPLHLAALQVLPTNGDGVGTIPVTIYPLEDDGAATAAAGDITPVVGSVTEDTNFQVKVNNILSEAFTVTSTDTVATITAKMTTAVAASVNLPVTGADGTTQLDVTSKWKGASANDIYLEIEGPTNAGMTWTFTQPTGGATNPDVDDALNQIGDVWESMLLNCMDVADTTTLAKYSTFGEGRWGALTKKPLMVFTGNLATTVANAIAVPDARKTDRTNAQLVAPGSVDLPFVTAGRQLARIISRANNNPPWNYAKTKADGLTPGADGDQWLYTQRDAAVKGGSSTIEVVDNVINLADIVTFYHPSGDPTPAYRYVVDVVKLQNIIFNLELIFASDEWAGAPLIPDSQVTTNSRAKKPKDAVAAVSALADSLALEAIISDPEAAKASIVAQINSTNPKRLDLTVTFKLSGNTEIISIDLNFGFFFG
jgi:phage tail sheath gpL-like